MAKVNHFELTADDPERAVKFYETVFGWEIGKWGGEADYWLCTTGEKEEPGIDGAIMRREPGMANNVVISVANMEESIEKIKEAGGTMVSEIMPIPGIGYSAYFKDTEDNLVGIFKWDCDAK